MFQTKIQSHEVSMLGSFRYSARKGGVEHEQGIEMLTDELDAIIETEEDQVKYGSNTEFDSSDFAQELYGRLYGQAEKVKDNEWSIAHSELEKMQEVKDLMSVVKSDPDLSMLGANYILHTLSEDIANVISEYRAFVEEPDNQDENGDVEPSDFKPSTDTSVSLQNNVKKLEELIEELKDAKPLIKAMAGKEDVSGENHEQDRSHIVKKLMDKRSVLRRVMEIVGRLQNAVSGLEANSMAQEMTDQEVIVGKAKFSHLVNSEKLYLADDATVDKFYSRHIKRNQYMFRQKGKNKKVGGPITVLVDESGSMEGQRQDIAKSVAAALYMMASEQNRDITVMGFDTCIRMMVKKKRRAMTATMSQGHYRKEMTDISAVSFIANRSTYGGTSFTVAIDAALKESKGKNADILFITDGADSIPQGSLDRILKSKEKDGTRIFTILLGTSNYSLRSVSDAVLPFSRLTDENITSLAKLMKSMER